MSNRFLIKKHKGKLTKVLPLEIKKMNYAVGQSTKPFSPPDKKAFPVTQAY